MRLKMVAVVVFILLFSVFSPQLGLAQVTVNPNNVEFTASTDHSAVGLDNVPLVTRYEMRVFLEGGTTVVAPAVDLGKPTPDATSKVVLTTAQIPGLWANLPKNTKMIAKVVAIGPTGEAVSDPSNPFGFSGPPAKPGVPAVVKR